LRRVVAGVLVGVEEVLVAEEVLPIAALILCAFLVAWGLLHELVY
jgi:hypothetical protein